MGEVLPRQNDLDLPGGRNIRAEATTAEVSQPGVEARPVEFLSRFFGAVLAINLGLLVFYEFVTFKYDVNSDSAVKVLLANEVVETGEFFPHDWVYANGDLYAFFSHSLAIALIPMFGPGFVTHALVGLSIGLGLLLASWWLLRELRFPRWQRLAIIALMASGISSLLAENLYGQSTYGFIITLNFLVISAALRFSRRFESGPRDDWLALVLLALLSTLIAWNNHKRALVMLTAPFLVSCALLGFARLSQGPWSFSRLKRVPELWLASVHTAAFALGALLNEHVLGRPLNNTDTVGTTTWLGPETIWRNVVQTVLGLLAQLGGVPPAGETVVSGWGVYEAFRLALAVVLLWGVVQAVRSLLASAQSPQRFVAVFALVSGTLAGLFYVFTTLPDMVSSLASARYLMPSALLGLLLLPARMTERPVEGGKVSLVTLGAIALTACCGATTLALAGYGGSGRGWQEAQAKGERRLELVSFLRQQGLRYGYASYWNAGVITMLSDGQVKVRQIELGQVPTPMHLHASNRWYRAPEWRGETFLLLTEAELSRLDRPLLESRVGSPSRTISFGDFKVLIYAHNLTALAGWSDLVNRTERFEITQSSLHVAGRFQPLEGERGVLSSTPGEPGALLFGPYLWLAPGRYHVSFDLSAEGTGPVGTLEITSRQSSYNLAREPIKPGPRGPRGIDFEIDEEEKFVEFRVVLNGRGSVSVYATSIERQGR